MSLRMVVAHPGADTSTDDVHRGLTSGLRALGVHMYDYSLNKRIGASGEYLVKAWRKAVAAQKKANPDATADQLFPKPTPADILYHASEPMIARSLRVQPDVVLIVSAMYVHPDIFMLAKRAGLKVATLFTESPYDDERQVRLLPYCDMAWTNERTSFARTGVKYLPHAWNPEVHKRDETVKPHVPKHDVVFVGTGFQERIDLLSEVDWTGIDLGLYGSWDLLGSRHKLRQFVKGGYLNNDKTAELYQHAKIGLNLYRESKGFGKDAPRTLGAESMNPRAYELAAMGCFTISNPRAELKEKFGDMVPTFRTAQELASIIRCWLKLDDRRKEIQAELPKIVAADTWHNRAKQVLDDLDAAGICKLPVEYAHVGSVADARCSGVTASTGGGLGLVT